MADASSIVAIAAGIAAVISAVASSWSAKNSGRSASAAEKSADASVKALHRAAVRELVMLCHETLTEQARMRSLAIDISTELTSAFNLSGAYGSSRETLQRAALEKDAKLAEEQTAEARQIAEHSDNLYAESTIYVSQAAARAISARDNLRVTRESMERHLSELRATSAERRAAR